MDNMSYCSVRSQEVNTMIGDIISGPCMNVDCTNPTCKDAVAKVSFFFNLLYTLIVLRSLNVTGPMKRALNAEVIKINLSK